jgi:hypothetical protein
MVPGGLPCGRTEEQHVVLADASFFLVDFANQRWQLLELVGWCSRGWSAVVPSVYSRTSRKLLNLSSPLIEERSVRF